MRVEVDGLDQVIDQMARMGELTGKAARAMLKAGANETQREWIATIKRMGHVRTGDMWRAVAATRVRKKGGLLETAVYPQGSSTKGVHKKQTTANALKAYVIHHSRPGDGMVDKITKNAAPDVEQAMGNVWGEFVNTGKVPKVQAKGMGED